MQPNRDTYKSSSISLVYLGDGYGVVAGRPLAAGEEVHEFEGIIMPEQVADPARSIQVSKDFALEWVSIQPIHDWVRGSRRPNCYVDFASGVPVLKALTAVEAGDEITIDYNLTRWNEKRPSANCP